jgi:hypothetical protein
MKLTRTMIAVPIVVAGVATVLPGCRRTTVVTQPPGGTVVHEARRREVVVVQPSAPPAVPVEVRTAAPAPDYVWVPGAYEWRGNRWELQPGRWMQPTRPSAVWVPGKWQPAPGGYGHWE